MTDIFTRELTQTDGTSPEGTPLTNAQVDTNFINLNDNKVEVSGAIIFEAKAGEALSKGDVVYVSGVSGNQPVVSKADANDASKMPAYGLAEADANLNAAVNVVTFGTLYDLNTSSFAAGDNVYVSTTAGAITTTAPTGESSLLQNIGTVIRSHASAGSIKVGGAGRTNATPNLNDGNVFIGNASNQAEARALTGDDISGGTITNFASTGIDDNATSTAVTLAASGNVGIGETSPDRLLHLKSSVPAIRLEDADVAGLYSEILMASNRTSFRADEANVDAGHYMTFRLGGAERIRIDSNGRVGIGTNSPTNALVVSDGDDGIELRTNLTDDNRILSYNRTASDHTKMSFDAANYDFRIGAAAPSVVIDSSGRVGIGTDSPQDLLHVFSGDSLVAPNGNYDEVFIESAGNAGITIGSGLTGLGGVIFAKSGGVTDGYLVYAHSDDTLRLGTANAERMRIDSNGNVGIGYTSPASMAGGTSTNPILSVGGSDTSLNTLGDRVGSLSFISRDGSFTSAFSDGVAGEVACITDTATGGGNALTFYTANSSLGRGERMRIDNSGNVGIGADNVTADFEVRRNGFTEMRLTRQDSSINITNGLGALHFTGSEDGITYTDAASIVAVAATNWSASDNGAEIYFTTTPVGTTSPEERMRIDDSGNVSVTTGDIKLPSEGQRLIFSTSGSPQNVFRSSDTYGTNSFELDAPNGFTVALDSNANNVGAFSVYDVSAVKNYFYVSPEGNVGIDQTNPATKLEVKGNTGSGSDAEIVRITSTDTVSRMVLANSVGQAGIDANGNIIRFTNGSSNTERMRIDTSGNVGIGTSTLGSSSKLTVASSNGTTGFEVIPSDADSAVILQGYERTGAAWRELRSYASTHRWNIYPTIGEAMRIDSNGSLLVGRTSTGNSASDYGMDVTADGRLRLFGNKSGTAEIQLWYNSGGSIAAAVRGNGGFANVQSNDLDLSDRRSKTDIESSQSYLNKLCKIPVRTYRYKHEENGKLHLGVIAQEVEAVCPEFVSKESWEYEGELLDTVYNKDMQFAMLKAIQEQQAMIEELKAEVASLKGA